MKKRVLSVIALLLSLAMFVVGCSSGSKSEESAEKAESAGDKSGAITVAYKAAPPNLDSDQSTDWTVTAVMNHVYEGLYEFNASSEAVPHLAKSCDIENDGKTYVFHLREGVLFHDGSEMKAEDVKASFDRWFAVNEMGISVSEYVDSVDVVDDYTVSVKLNSVYAPFLNVIASPTSNQKMVVRPASLIEKYGNDVLEEHIGTGPYKFDSWVPDASVKLVKFDDYVPVEGEASGFAGKRVAYANEINIQFVTDESVRVSGLETGEFMFAEEISQDKYSQVESSENTVPQIMDSDVEGMLTFNCGAAPFDDLNARKAVAIGLDLEELATAQIGDENFWSLDGCLFDKSTVWYDEKAGEGVYAKNDLELAKEYLAKSDYNGEPVVIVQGKDDNVESQGAEDLRSQLEKIGFNVEVELYDRATVMEKRSQKEGWAIHLAYFSVWNADPQVWSAWVGTNGWITNWDDENSKKMDEIFAKMLVELDQDARYKLVQDWYNTFWEYVPYVKTIDYSRMNATNAKLQGYANYCQPFSGIHGWKNNIALSNKYKRK